MAQSAEPARPTGEATALGRLAASAALVCLAVATVTCGARSDLFVGGAIDESDPADGGAGGTDTGGGATGGSGGVGGDPCDVPEICNGLDDDCDGYVDEGCSPLEAGCSDGTREGFLIGDLYPDIAGCSGGWTLPGVLMTLDPMCDRQSGNDSDNPTGQGCTVADLCESGWHVCEDEQAVASHSPDGCLGAMPKTFAFFTTRRSSNGCGHCANGTNTDPVACNGCTCVAGCAQTLLTANDLFGCGNLGGEYFSCGILDRFSNNLCQDLGPPWSCPGDGCDEAHTVTKPGSDGGGALCCRD